MAVATGAIVANLYYLQPLLNNVARSFHIGVATATVLLTLIQVGYAAGLALVVPLGDLVARRRLVTIIFGLAGLCTVAAALIPSFIGFAIVTFFIGVVSVGGQVMIPLAADLADPDQRGRVVARLMSGLLIGILVSRTISGYVSELAGWRGVYWLAAALMVLFAVFLGLTLPTEQVRPHVRYHQLVLGSFLLLKELPELRRRAWLGAMGFASFSVLWSTLAFELSSPYFHLSNGTIGLFGLFGVAGVVAANVAGSFADTGHTKLSSILSTVLVLASFGILALGDRSLVVLILGIVVLDAGCQGLQITNQSIIYRLAPESRSRITSAYMVCYFVGGAAGSIAGGLAYGARGWAATCAVGAGFALAALIPTLLWTRSPSLPELSPQPERCTPLDQP